MPAELRFCRNCGFRLGTGSAIGNQPLDGSGKRATALPKKRRRMSGMAWVFVGLLVFFVGAALHCDHQPGSTSNVGGCEDSGGVKSYVGVDGWDTVDNGVTFGSVDAPDGPADKAGLVGGDIITKFDGQEVHDEDQMDELMKKTPIGKTVEVEYLRDGEKKTTKLTTVSHEEFQRLSERF